MHGVFLDLDSLHPDDLELSDLRDCLAGWTFHRRTDPDQVAERIAGAQVIVTNKVRLCAEHLAGAQTLRLICVAATGTDNVDLEPASW